MRWLFAEASTKLLKGGACQPFGVGPKGMPAALTLAQSAGPRAPTRVQGKPTCTRRNAIRATGAIPDPAQCSLGLVAESACRAHCGLLKPARVPKGQLFKGGFVSARVLYFLRLLGVGVHLLWFWSVWLAVLWV